MTDSSSQANESHPFVTTAIVLLLPIALGVAALTLLGADKTLPGLILTAAAAVLGVISSFYAVYRAFKVRPILHAIVALVGILGVTALLWSAGAATGGRASVLGPALPPGVVGFVGDCETFTIYAQNRWSPIGAARYSAPYQDAERSFGFAGNAFIRVDGWVETESAPSGYTAPPPFNGMVWYHLADNTGWVYIAGVRAQPTVPDPDPNQQGDAGLVPAMPAACKGAVA